MSLAVKIAPQVQINPATNENHTYTAAAFHRFYEIKLDANFVTSILSLVLVKVNLLCGTE